jgi:hypothetical protein
MSFGRWYQPFGAEERKRRWGVAIHAIFKGGGAYIYGYEGSQAVPTRPSGKGRFSEGKAFGNGDDEMKSGAKREIGHGFTAFVFEF